MVDLLTLLAHAAPWTIAAYVGSAFIGMALQAWQDRRST